jgi:hypothetical protein
MHFTSILHLCKSLPSESLPENHLLKFIALTLAPCAIPPHSFTKMILPFFSIHLSSTCPFSQKALPLTLFIMNTNQIVKILSGLQSSRQLFHSEADFQFSFAWAIKEEIPDASVFLEFPFKKQGLNESIYIDIVLHYQNSYIPIELKYKTQLLSFETDVIYHLKNQSANDISRYDTLKDIARMENLVNSGFCNHAYVIFLTNEHNYWQDTGYTKSMDSQFRFHQGKILKGLLDWQGVPSPGTTKNRDKPIRLSNSYECNWHPYSKIPNIEKNNVFKYIIFKVS